MSVRVMSAAWLVEVEPVQKLVLLALADHANDETFKCWPSITHLCKKTGLGRSTVARALRSLENDRIIGRQKRGQQTTVYVLNVANWCQSGTSARAGLVPERDGASPAEALGVVPERDDPSARAGHGTVIEPSVEPSMNRKGARGARGKHTIDTFLTNCKTEGTEAIPEDDPVFRYCDEAGIPIEFCELAWREFVAQYQGTEKKYKDWRAAFRNCVRRNWFRLWWVDDNGAYHLTSAGKQANNKHRRAA